MKVYIARKHTWKAPIASIDVEKATNKSVWVAGVRYSRITNYHSIFDTFAEARTWLLMENAKEMDQIEAKLRLLRNDSGTYFKLEPEDADEVTRIY